MGTSLEKRKDVAALIRAFVSCSTDIDMWNFMRDLMTEKEILEFANRLHAAELLFEGGTYEAVSQQTGMSSTTVARVSKWLVEGCGGYRTVLQNIRHHHHTKKIDQSGVSS